MTSIVESIELCANRLLQFKALFLFVGLVLLLIRYTSSRTGKNLPPGPWGIPVLGFLPFFNAVDPHIQLEGLKKKYGDIFGFYLGSKYVFFIGELSKCKAAYYMDELCGRPDGAFSLSDRSTHFASINGQPWKERRKISMQALRQLGVGTKMIENAAIVQTKIAIEKFEEIVSSNPGSDVNTRDTLTHATLSIALQFVCGKTFSSEHENYKTFDRFFRYFGENGAVLSLQLYLPWTKPFLSTLTKTGKDTRKIFDDMENFIRHEIDMHVKNCPETPKDLIDFYVKHYEKNGCRKLPIDDISGDAQVMVFAGADTTRASIEWFLLCMAEYQEVQQKVFEEIDRVLGSSGEVCYDDRAKLPYAEAAILESFRYKGIAPINSLHGALKDTTLFGYHIPKDSIMFSLLWTIHHDPAHWIHPQEFYPEHFLTLDKSAVKIPEAFLAFSLGKRMCPGDKVAMIETFLFCVSLVHRFQILPPDGGTKMDSHMCINVEPAYPIVKMVKRYN